MFDTMTMTKTMGALCSTFLVLLLGKWAATELYATGGGHGDSAEQAYLIEIDSGDGAGEKEEGPDFATLLAEADAGKGERVFGKCKACHKIDGTDGTGPHLNGVVGRDAGAVGGFKYSGSFDGVVDVWTPEHLQEFLANPRGYAPGTTMGFGGLKKIQDRANLIAYLQTTQ